MTTACETGSKPGGTRYVQVKGHWVNKDSKDRYWRTRHVRELSEECIPDIQTQIQPFLGRNALRQGNGSIERMLGDSFQK